MPPTSPETVSSFPPVVLLLIRVVPPPLTARAPVILRAEVVLSSVIAETFEPMPALINERPVPVPELVIVPMGLTLVLEIVMPPFVALLLRQGVSIPGRAVPRARVKSRE